MTNWSAMNNQEAKTKKTEQIMIFAQIMERRYISRQISAIHKCQLLLALLVFSIFFLSGLDGLLHLRESPGCRKFSDIQAWGNLIDGLLQILADFTNPISINQTLLWLCQPLCKCCSVSRFYCPVFDFSFRRASGATRSWKVEQMKDFWQKVSGIFPKHFPRYGAIHTCFRLVATF